MFWPKLIPTFFAQTMSCQTAAKSFFIDW
jgi:hypothetical protein